MINLLNLSTSTWAMASGGTLSCAVYVGSSIDFILFAEVVIEICGLLRTLVFFPMSVEVRFGPRLT